MRAPNFTVSILIPVFNEKENIDPLLERLLPIITTYSYEVIFINDGSRDGTDGKIKEHATTNSKIKLISFSRNFGHMNALSSGYAFAQGDCVISIDADCQDPPEIIPEMIEKWVNGTEIVYAKRQKREVDSFFKKTTAKFFYKLINFLSEVPIPQEVGDYRLLDRTVVDFLNELPEHSKFFRGLVAWSGYSTEYVYFNREKRYAGKTHYSFSKMLNFALDGVTSFSIKPLRMASYLGFVSALIGFIGINYALVGKFFRPSFFPQDWVSGWTLLFISIMFTGGVQLITIGIIGEYISKIFIEVQRRPHYILKEKVNI